MSEKNDEFTITAEAGNRLDKALEKFLPATGLRGRRRLCLSGLVSVNGAPKPPAYKVSAGDKIRLATQYEDSPPILAQLVRATPHLAALFKPSGLHTAQIAGQAGPALETQLGLLLPGGLDPGYPKLLNRLDEQTSGLVMAALDRNGLACWKANENHIVKKYLVLLQGALPHYDIARTQLNVNDTKTVKPRNAPDPDPARHTAFVPLQVLDAGEVAEAFKVTLTNIAQVTLAGCVISRGARHQIRAHASSLGLPALGDQKYSARPVLSNGSWPARPAFWLHHAKIELPGFSAVCLPDWLGLLPKAAGRASEKWLAFQATRL